MSCMAGVGMRVRLCQGVVAVVGGGGGGSVDQRNTWLDLT